MSEKEININDIFEELEEILGEKTIYDEVHSAIIYYSEQDFKISKEEDLTTLLVYETCYLQYNNLFREIKKLGFFKKF